MKFLNRQNKQSKFKQQSIQKYKRSISIGITFLLKENDMAGKKWCQYCRINIAYSKKEIQDHEATRSHLQNKQKSIKYQRIKIRKQRQQKKQNQHQVMLGTANIPKAKKGSQLQQQIQSYKDSIYQEGKNAIHRLIAQKTKGMYGAPIQYPQKQQLVLADNYELSQNQNNDSEEKEEVNYKMWKIDICQTTGQPCFINRVTKLILYEPPKGYVLTQEEKVQWEELKQICKQKVQVNPDATVNISQWEEVPDQQNYFEQYRAVQSSEEEQQLKSIPKNEQNNNQADYSKYLAKRQQDVKQQKSEQKAKIKTWKQQLEEKLMKNQISTDQVFEKFIDYEMRNSKTVKQKNDNLKKLIESGIQVRARPIDELLLGQSKDIPRDNEGQKPKVLFKPRKKVQLSTASNLQLNKQADIF